MEMLERKPAIKALLDERNWSRLRETVSNWAAPEIADLLLELDKPERVLLFRVLPRDVAADAFSYLERGARDALIRDLSDEETRHLLDNLSPDDRTELLSELPGEVTRRLLNLLSAEDLKQVRELLGYPEDSVGRLMTPEYAAVRPDWTISRSLGHIRFLGKDSETIDVVFVTDRAGRLLGKLELRRLILSDPATTIEQVMDTNVESIWAYEHREQAVQMVQHYDLKVLPVVSSEGILLGIITVDDVLDVAQEEATEDIQKMGGMEALDAPYPQVTMWAMARKRGPWLAILFVGQMLTATAMAFFETEIAEAVVLALFIPLIISSGGNTGSQAASLIVRSLALREMRLRNWFIVFRRELLIGFALGAVLGVIGLLRVAGWQWLGLADYGEHYMRLAVTIWVSLIGVVTFGTVAGAMLPFIMRRLGFDPAVSSTPFVATLVDVTGLVIYFTVAQLILSGALL